uniref:Uncharacterized protein n=1 Tax=Anopheles melas TaxID=34690 RepID=A0A182U8V7_9DIPT
MVSFSACSFCDRFSSCCCIRSNFSFALLRNAWNESIDGFGLFDVGVFWGDTAAASDDQALFGSWPLLNAFATFPPFTSAGGGVLPIFFSFGLISKSSIGFGVSINLPPPTPGSSFLMAIMLPPPLPVGIIPGGTAPPRAPPLLLLLLLPACVRSIERSWIAPTLPALAPLPSPAPLLLLLAPVISPAMPAGAPPAPTAFDWWYPPAAAAAAATPAPERIKLCSGSNIDGMPPPISALLAAAAAAAADDAILFMTIWFMPAPRPMPALAPPFSGPLPLNSLAKPLLPECSWFCRCAIHRSMLADSMLVRFRLDRLLERVERVLERINEASTEPAMPVVAGSTPETELLIKLLLLLLLLLLCVLQLLLWLLLGLGGTSMYQLLLLLLFAHLLTLRLHLQGGLWQTASHTGQVRHRGQTRCKLGRWR